MTGARNTLKIAIFGSSLLSAYWNGAATYYRGILKALYRRGGYNIAFFEPDAYDRQQHKDIAPPDYARVVVYENSDDGVREALMEATRADWIIKASGVGVFDTFLEAAIPNLRDELRANNPNVRAAFWDVDAPATLSRMENDVGDDFRLQVARYDVVLTYGGGNSVVNAYAALGARVCVPIYNALDPETHFPAAVTDARFVCDLAFLGNRMPDREVRVDEFFFRAATLLPDRHFLLAGSGWHDKSMPANVTYIGHLRTADHNAFNASARVVLNISRESMARFGFSPATRVFEATGAGACLITDDWPGVAEFFAPNREILVAADGADVAVLLRDLSDEQAKSIGSAALRRVLSEHTYDQRAELLDSVLRGETAQ